MELIATVGADDANSYVTEADATAYLAGRLHTEPWFEVPATLSVPDGAWRRSAALIWATRLLDEQVGWYGMPATTTQALAWPRQGLLDPWGRTIAVTAIPTVVQLATTLYALALLRDTSESSTASASNVKVQQFGNTRLEFFAPGSPTTAVPSHRLPVEIRRMLTLYGHVSGGLTVPLVRT